MRQYNLPDAHETSVMREERIFIHVTHTRTLFYLQLFYQFCVPSNEARNETEQ